LSGLVWSCLITVLHSLAHRAIMSTAAMTTPLHVVDTRHEVKFCRFMSCLDLPCVALSCLALPCLLSCLVMSCLVMSCHFTACHLMSCLALSCLALPCHVVPCLVMSCLALSCLALPLLISASAHLSFYCVSLYFEWSSSSSRRLGLLALLVFSWFCSKPRLSMVRI
jgi:hypothetical protein